MSKPDISETKSRPEHTERLIKAQMKIENNSDKYTIIC